MGRLFALALTFALALACLNRPTAYADTPAGPSFDCSKASGIDAAICADPALSADDRQLTDFYQAAKPGVLGAGSNQLADQRDWLKQRDRTCAGAAWKTTAAKSLNACIASTYEDRLQTLAVATLFARPDVSMAELRRLSPKAAPIYEALYRYATTDDPAQRAKTTEALLTPIYAAMDSDTRDSFQSAGGQGATAHAAATSDADFGRFFDIESMSFEDGGLTWSCGALLKRPGLIDGLGAFWGSSMDSQLPSSDCASTLPPVPAVEAVSQAAMDAQAPCDGTIRFAGGRNYAQLQDAVRLYRPDVWAAAAKKRLGSDALAFERKHAAQVAAAKTALATYYEQVFKVPAAQATHDAGTGVDALVAQGLDFCD